MLLAASEQITLALKDAQQPIDVLGASLGKLAALLAADAGDAPTAQQLAALRGEMARAVTGLQFYDRMAQHLNHVRDYLTHSAEHIGSEVGIPAEPWASTHQTLANRLLSETHRMFLGKNFPEEFMANRGGLSREERGAASPGDIDLF
ncbi:MAG: hypothetical protein ABIP38_15155 [Steroidobacteraceae bacterium]